MNHVPPDSDHQPHTILGEIPLWIAVVGVALFLLIVKGLYNPYA